MLRVYGDLGLRVRWYRRRRLAYVYVVVWRGDAIARYLHRVRPGGGDDLCAVTLVIGQGDRRHRMDGLFDERQRAFPQPRPTLGSQLPGFHEPYEVFASFETIGLCPVYQLGL